MSYECFPGYEKNNAEKLSKTENKKVAREQKLKNALPPFLMVRAGVYNHIWWCALLALGGIAATQIPTATPTEDVIKFLLIGLCFGISIGAFAPIAEDKERKVKPCIKQIKEALHAYADGKTAKLAIVDNEYKRMTAALIRYLAKNNPNIFANMIKNPASVDDMKIAEQIIRGHIKSHPEDAQVALDRFWSNTIPQRLYNKLKNITYWEKQK